MRGVPTTSGLHLARSRRDKSPERPTLDNVLVERFCSGSRLGRVALEVYECSTNEIVIWPPDLEYYYCAGA